MDPKLEEALGQYKSYFTLEDDGKKVKCEINGHSFPANRPDQIASFIKWVTSIACGWLHGTVESVGWAWEGDGDGKAGHAHAAKVEVPMLLHGHACTGGCIQHAPVTPVCAAQEHAPLLGLTTCVHMLCAHRYTIMALCAAL